MATQWMDDFTSYGTDSNASSRLLNGPYGFSVRINIVPDPDPTSAGQSVVQAYGGGTGGELRRVLNGAQTTVGVAGRYWLANLPTAAGTTEAPQYMVFKDTNNVAHIIIMPNPSGYLEIYRADSGTNVLLGATSKTIPTNAWQHVECQVVFSSTTTGSVQIRVEGVTQVTLTGIRTVNNVSGALASCQNVSFGGAQDVASPSIYVKDYIIWDNTTSVNNTFFGTCAVYKLVSASDINPNWVPTLLGPTTVNAPTTSTTGGTLAAGTYYYKISAISPAGESLPSSEVSQTTTGTTSTVSLSWSAVTNATGYKIYRGTAAGAENVFYAPTGTGTSFTDTGAANSGGTPLTSTPGDWNKINDVNPDDDYGYISSSIISSPTNGTLTQTAAGALAATTYYVRCTWVNAYGETAASNETSLAVSANNVLNVAFPPSPPSGATGWNVYVSTATGTETKQNGGTPLGLAANWVEPTTGLVAGTAFPGSNTTMNPAATFHLTQLPPNTSSVRSVMVLHRSRKTDGGDGWMQTGLISSGVTGLGSNRPITTAYTYWWDIFEQDPNGSIPWTKTSVNNVTLQINRTT